MRRVKILPYKAGSAGAKALARGLGVLRIKQNGNFILKNGTTIINWGNQAIPDFRKSRKFTGDLTLLNKPVAISKAINKIEAFKALEQAGVSIPKYALTKAEANAFLSDNGIIVCRTNIAGRSGAGIVIARTPEQVVNAPLYTRHVRHRDEYRVHVVNGKIIDFAQKRKRKGTEPDILVRCHGDWIFARVDTTLPDDVAKQAVEAVKALGLDFGAVDVGYSVKEQKAYVFEVNTAPGFDIGSSTQAAYIKAFTELLGV